MTTSTKTRFKPETTIIQMSADRSQDFKLTLSHDRKGYFIRQTGGGMTHKSLPFKTVEEAHQAWPVWFVPLAIKAAEAGFPLEAQRVKTGRKIPCPGAAHKNAFIDHCMCCLGGEWGFVDEYAPIDLDFAREARLDVPLPDLTSEQYDVIRSLEVKGEVEVDMRCKGNCSRFVARWTGK